MPNITVKCWQSANLGRNPPEMFQTAGDMLKYHRLLYREPLWEVGWILVVCFGPDVYVENGGGRDALLETERFF